MTLRPWVWLEVSGAAKKKAAHAANYYSIMVKAGETSPFAKEIEQVRSELPLLIIAVLHGPVLTWVVPAHFLLWLQDSVHTFPDHAWLASAEGQGALNRVLQVRHRPAQPCMLVWVLMMAATKDVSLGDGASQPCCCFRSMHGTRQQHCTAAFVRASQSWAAWAADGLPAVGRGFARCSPVFAHPALR